MRSPTFSLNRGDFPWASAFQFQSLFIAGKRKNGPEIREPPFPLDKYRRIRRYSRVSALFPGFHHRLPPEQAAAENTEQSGSGHQDQQNPEKTVHIEHVLSLDFPPAGIKPLYKRQRQARPGRGGPPRSSRPEDLKLWRGWPRRNSPPQARRPTPPPRPPDGFLQPGSAVSSGSTGR